MYTWTGTINVPNRENMLGFKVEASNLRTAVDRALREILPEYADPYRRPHRTPAKGASLVIAIMRDD